MDEKKISEVKETAMKGALAAKGLVGEITNKEMEVIEKLATIVGDRETEIRLKFDNLTLNGDAVIAISVLKKGN